MIGGPDGELSVVGRYRNHGDSRTGIASGQRGLELAVFRSRDQGGSFEKVISLKKQDLTYRGRSVLSIEGTAICRTRDGIVVYLSTEKDGVGYPGGFGEYLKPGTGVWSIDRIRAGSIEDLSAAAIEMVLESVDPETIHVKDPFLHESRDGKQMFFCSHPFSWTCANTGYGSLHGAGSTEALDRDSLTFDFFPRGNVWDVAMSRGTCIIDVPSVGAFKDQNIQLMFYDGGECVRDHHQHAKSVTRPRGHSCEELGGAAYFLDTDWTRSTRLSRLQPMFVSPYGSGSSRYVDILARPEGMYATWQQAQPDGSQPLVMNFVTKSEIEQVLS